MKKAIIIGLAICMLLLAACGAPSASNSPSASASSGASTSASAAGSAQTSAGSKDPVIIGIVNDLSGSRSVSGVAITNGATMAAEEINKNGGVLGGRQIKLVVYDNKNDSTESINAYTRAVDVDKASAVITSDASSICLSLIEISNEKKVSLIGMPSDPRATVNQDTGKAYPYMFLVTQPNAMQQASIMAYFLKENTKMTKAAVFYDQGNAYTTTSSQAFIKIWKDELGLEVVDTETCNTNDQDYKTQLTKIKNSGAEFIYAPNTPAQLTMMVQQAAQIGLNIPYTGALDMADPFLSNLPDRTAVTKAWFQSIVWLPDQPLQDFYAAYKTRFNVEPQMKSINGYDAMYVLYNAIEAAGSDDREAIRNSMENDIKDIDLLVSDHYSEDPATHAPLNQGMVINTIDKGVLSRVTFYEIPESARK
jgi:branched-chain amino acid transport system substrate-binding protein